MVTIRQATANDVDVLYQLIIAIAEYHQQADLVTTTPAQLLTDGFGEHPKFGVLLAEQDGVAVGYCTYTWHYSIWLGEPGMNIDDLFVLAQARGNNIGLRLMEQAKVLCLKKGIRTLRWQVESDNEGAKAFYRRLGASIETKGVCRWDVS